MPFREWIAERTLIIATTNRSGEASPSNFKPVSLVCVGIRAHADSVVIVLRYRMKIDYPCRSKFDQGAKPVSLTGVGHIPITDVV